MFGACGPCNLPSRTKGREGGLPKSLRPGGVSPDCFLVGPQHPHLNSTHTLHSLPLAAPPVPVAAQPHRLVSQWTNEDCFLCSWEVRSWAFSDLQAWCPRRGAGVSPRSPPTPSQEPRFSLPQGSDSLFLMTKPQEPSDASPQVIDWLGRRGHKNSRWSINPTH